MNVYTFVKIRYDSKGVTRLNKTLKIKASSETEARRILQNRKDYYISTTDGVVTWELLCWTVD